MSIKSYKTWLDYVFVVSKKIDQKSKEIIIKGFTEENKDLKQYFLREFKKAFALDYSETEFFEGLLDVISLFKEQIVHQMNEEKNRLHDKLIEAKESINSDSEAAQSLIQSITERLTQIKPEDEYLALSLISEHKVNKKMPYIDILKLEYVIKEARIEVLRTPQNGTDTPKPKSIGKTFEQYLIHEQRIDFAQALKEEFNTEKGKKLKVMIHVLKSLQLISIQQGEMMQFFNSMNDFFQRDIGSYQSINDPEIKSDSSKKSIEAATVKINKALSKLNKAKVE